MMNNLTCKILSQKSSDESEDFEEDKPEFVLLPEDVTASPGETIKLKCKVNGKTKKLAKN